LIIAIWIIADYADGADIFPPIRVIRVIRG
jgi:hypothetical protein